MSEIDSEGDSAVLPLKAKKRVSYGRMKNVAKLLKLRSHETGPSCNCTRLKCFENVAKEERIQIIKQFNALKNHDEQNLHLGGLISHIPVKRHRSRKNNDEDVEYHSYSYTYKIRVQRDNKAIEVPVCYKAMLSMHGISAKRLQNIQQQLVTLGRVKHDERGQHSNRKNRLPGEICTAVCEHIASFKSRKSH